MIEDKHTCWAVQEFRREDPNATRGPSNWYQGTTGLTWTEARALVKASKIRARVARVGARTCPVCSPLPLFARLAS